MGLETPGRPGCRSRAAGLGSLPWRGGRDVSELLEGLPLTAFLGVSAACGAPAAVTREATEVESTV